MSFVHVVLISFYASVPQEKRAVTLRRLEGLGAACGGIEAGILHWKAIWNLDQRKAYHVVEFAVFTDDNAFQAFRTHPVHIDFSNDLREIADWVIGDLYVDSQEIASAPSAGTAPRV